MLQDAARGSGAETREGRGAKGVKETEAGSPARSGSSCRGRRRPGPPPALRPPRREARRPPRPPPGSSRDEIEVKDDRTWANSGATAVVTASPAHGDDGRPGGRVRPAEESSYFSPKMLRAPRRNAACHRSHSIIAVLELTHRRPDFLQKRVIRGKGSLPRPEALLRSRTLGLQRGKCRI